MPYKYKPLSPEQIAAIVPGSTVFYTTPGSGTWSAIVYRVYHSHRESIGSWAEIRFDGVVVPAHNACGIKGVDKNTDLLEVDFDKLVPRQPNPDDDDKRAQWQVKVAAYAAHMATIKAAEHTAKMARFSHITVGMEVRWSTCTDRDMGHYPSIYTNYIGKVIDVKLQGLQATVSGVPEGEPGEPEDEPGEPIILTTGIDRLTVV